MVTGGAGYIGATATSMLLNADYEVSVLDDCSTGHVDAVDPRARFTQGSILDRAAVGEAMKNCDAVMHFAGKSLVGESVEKPELYMQVNVEGSALLLEVMKQFGVERVVFSSSAATYGEPREVPIVETSATNPTNPYGLSKLRVDQLLSHRSGVDGFAAISLRYFNVAGAFSTPRGWLAERHAPETHLIPNVLRATTQDPLKIFGTDWPTLDKTCVRDYVHVVDLVEAHMAALDALVAGRHQIINLGSGTGYSVRQVANASAHVVGHPIPTIELGRRDGDPAVLIASIQKAKEFLNWEPTRGLEQMISDAYASLR